MKIQSITHSLFRNSKTAAILAALLLGPSAVQAADYTWSCPDDFWDITGCWSPSGTPVSTSTVDVLTVSGTNTRLKIDDITGTANADSLLIDASAGTSVTLLQTGGNLTVNNETIGLNGSGSSVFEQSGGTHTVNNWLFISSGTGNSGSYSLSGTGSNLAANYEFIGDYGTGTFTQNGGTHTVATGLFLGWNGSSSSGTYNLNAGSLATGAVNIGLNGSGTFIQNGGTHVVSNDLTFGQNSTGNGTYNMNGGTLTVNGDIVNGIGEGTLNIDGGTVSSTNGYVGNSTDVFDSGPNGLVFSRPGVGTAAVDGVGSTWANTSDLYVGNEGGTGTLNITNGGTVTNANGFIATKAFTYNSLPDPAGEGSELYIFGSDGTVTVSGMDSRWSNSGGLDVGGGGTGILTVDTGGSVDVANKLSVWSLGIVNLDGGTITTGSLSNTGVFNFNSGNLNITGTGAFLTEDLDSNFTLNELSHLDVAGDARIGGGSVFSLVGAGSSWTNAGTLYVGGFNAFDTGDGTLNIQDGGTVSSLAGVLGYDDNGINTATIEDIGSNWANGASLTVGWSGTGNLNIDNGGEVTSDTGILGRAVDGIGTATIDGIGSAWDSSGDLTVGQSGTGTLNINNGGAVSNTNGYVGKSTSVVDNGPSFPDDIVPGIGTVAVDGVGSSWASSGNLYVGDEGTGTLNVKNGGTVSNGTGWIGNAVGSNGTAMVVGVGSNWTSPGNLTVGHEGTGNLNINNGGMVSNGVGWIGNAAGSIGTATVDGVGSTWANSNNLFVGASGTGNLTISNGGLVSTSVDGILGFSLGGNGTATVDGVGSTWANSNNLLVGFSGTGTLNIINGGLVSNVDGYLGISSGSTDTATVDGVGSTWANSNNLFVGFPSGTGTLNIQNGGEVSVGGQVLNGTGTSTINLDGGSLSVTGIDIDVDNFNIGNSALSTGSHTIGAGKTLTADVTTVGYSGGGTLNINNGGTVSNTTGYLGRNGGSNGTATIEGIGSTWANSNTLFVGSQGTGNLTINNGGEVSDQEGYLGSNSGSTGTATVDGVGSKWANSASLYVGSGGTGTLNINNGGAVSNVGGYLGYNSGSNGTATVDGVGSKWTNFTNLYVGDSGTGNLMINNGGEVSNSIGYLGHTSGSNGTATVDGGGSKWDNSSNLFVGDSGTGNLMINNGGEVSNSVGFLGSTSGSTGTATVDGVGSKWANSSNLFVGRSGAGTLNINNGGTVSNANGELGTTSGSTGTATVDGVGSTWANSINLSVGRSGTGTLIISNGGTVSNANGFLGFNAGSTGTATVGGAGSTWTNNFSLYVGGNAAFPRGAGTLTVNAGGTVNVTNTLKIWNTGIVNLNGGTLNTATLDSEGSFNFNAGRLGITTDLLMDTTGPLGNSLVLNGFKTLAVSGTTTLGGFSSLTVDGGTFSTGSLINNGGFAFNSGTFNLTGDDLAVGAGGLFGGVLQVGLNQNINVSNNTTVDGSGVLYLNGGSFSSGNLVNNGQVAINGLLSELGGALGNNGLLNGDGRVSAVLTNNASGEVQVGSGDTLRFSAAGNSNSGEINLSSGTARFDQDLTNASGGVIAGRGTLIADAGLTNDGDLNLSGGTTDIFGNVNNTGTGGIIVTGGSTTTLFDDLVHNGTDKIRVTEGSQLVIFGTASGDGSYEGLGDLWFEGGLSPGNSPAQVSTAGNATYGLDSSNVMEIAGLARGTEYDAFDVGNTLTLAGELNVELLDLFTPQLGDIFDLFTAKTIAGEFDLLSLAALGGGLGWQLDVLVDAIGGITDVVRLSVVNSAVPVPAAVWLFCSGLLGLIGMARRRQSA
jgi:T5SS/PEP-CTERM-associated repeat protein